MNYAFYAEGIDITSCDRPDIIDDSTRDSVPIDEQQYAQIGVFSMDDNGDDASFLFLANTANVALDNIRIEVADSVSTAIRFAAIGGRSLIMDSEIEDGHDVCYDGDQCSVIYNDRLSLSNDSSMISRLMIECQSHVIGDADFNEQHTMDSAVTVLVDHFSMTTLWVVPFSLLYLPRMNMVREDGSMREYGSALLRSKMTLAKRTQST